MIWVYRVIALIFLGYGTYVFLGDLPPHDAYMFPGLEFGIGLYYLATPGALNLINSSLGSRFGLVRWALVLINLVLVVAHVDLVRSFGVSFPLLSLPTGALVLLVLSFLLARTWAKAAKEAKEAA